MRSVDLDPLIIYFLLSLNTILGLLSSIRLQYSHIDDFYYQDYLVLLPEEYYSPRNLALKVTKPCTLSRDEKYCVHYTYPTLKKEGIVTIQAEDSSVVGGIRRSQRVGDVPFQGRLLSGSRVSWLIVRKIINSILM